MSIHEPETSRSTLGFMQRFDVIRSDLPYREQLEAANQFLTAMEGLFRLHPRAVRNVPADVDRLLGVVGYEHSWLKLRVADYDTSTAISFLARTYPTKPDMLFSLDVIAARTMPDEQTHRYTLERTKEAARRYDSPYARSYADLDGQPLPKQSIQDVQYPSVDFASDDYALRLEAAQQQRLAEAQLGFNDQPIGLAEAKALGCLLMQATAVYPRWQ